MCSCAQVVPPSGGKKDRKKPEIQDIYLTKEDQEINLTFIFNEHIQFNNWSENFYISPPIKNPIKQSIAGKTLVLKIQDTLSEKLTYNISLDNCIKDMTEANILDSLHFLLSPNNLKDSSILSGKLIDAYSLDPIDNNWVMLFDEHIIDSLIFENSPRFVAKTNSQGGFVFPNLKKGEKYKVFALSGFDFLYDKEEKVAFYNKKIEVEKDTFIYLYSFKPYIEEERKTDSINNNITDTINENLAGNILIITNNTKPCVFQLQKSEKIIHEYYFDQPPFILKDVRPDTYTLKYIEDLNQDKKWNTGDLQLRIYPEKVSIYSNKITIRENWDLEIEWDVSER